MSDSPFLDSTLPAQAPLEARYIWAKVTQSSPLRIQPDGDRVPLGITPDDLGGAGSRSVNDRVYCQILNRRLVVLGPVIGGMPVGSVVASAGGLAPGFLWCAGTAVSRTAYAALFAFIGTIYGAGNGTTTFNLPNLVGRVIVMQDVGQAEFNVQGETGGEKTHLLTATEMPSHTHLQNSHHHPFTDGGQQPFGMYFGGNAGGFATFGLQVQVANTNTYQGPYVVSDATAVNQNTGGGGAHNNLQPYLTMNYMIRA